MPTAVSTGRLSQLADRLNDTYGCPLAKVHNASPRTAVADVPAACVVVSRGTTPDDVIAAVSVDSETGVYAIAVFTSAAWFEYGDPFACTERDAVLRAAAYVLQFVPETPCT